MSSPKKFAYSPATGLDLIEQITVGDALRRAADMAPDLPALKEGVIPDRRQWTYAELLTDAERVARAMLNYVNPGERVAIWASNVPEWILVQLGAALAGVTLVTVNPALRLQETAYILAHSGAAMVFHLDSYRGFDMTACLRAIQPELPDLRHTVVLSDWEQFCAQGTGTIALPRVSPDDIAQIQYTSGTTGRPKGAALRHRSIVNAARLALCRELGLSEGDSLVNPMPLFHTAGSAFQVLGCIQARATHVLPPAFDPELLLALVAAERACCFVCVPTMMRAILDDPASASAKLPSLRFVVCGGAPVEPALIGEVERKLAVPLLIAYGQTECSGLVSVTRRDDDPCDRYATIGLPIMGVEVRIVDPIERTLVMEVGAVGELCTRGYHVMARYHDDPEKTAEAFDDQGWLHTGDLASMDDNGRLKIEGRLKDMIIRGGENICPTEIEAALLEHQAVAEASVVGRPDDYWGEVVVAFVRLRPGINRAADELQAALASKLAQHKIPREWHFVDEFPLNATGKILKTELRKRAVEGT
jgi:fatty-acyl-CoA synthase